MRQLSSQPARCCATAHMRYLHDRWLTSGNVFPELGLPNLPSGDLVADVEPVFPLGLGFLIGVVIVILSLLLINVRSEPYARNARNLPSLKRRLARGHFFRSSRTDGWPGGVEGIECQSAAGSCCKWGHGTTAPLNVPLFPLYYPLHCKSKVRGVSQSKYITRMALNSNVLREFGSAADGRPEHENVKSVCLVRCLSD